MLEHLGEVEAAQAIVNGIEATTKAGILTGDAGGNATTQQIADSVIKCIQEAQVPQLM